MHGVGTELFVLRPSHDAGFVSIRVTSRSDDCSTPWIYWASQTEP